MTIRRLLSKLLAAFAVFGMLLAPLAPSAMAMSTPRSMTTEMSVPTGGEMPCCPDQAHSKNCAKSCPLMAMCVNQTLLNNVEYQVSILMQLLDVSWPPSDAAHEGVDAFPPPRPPRSFV